MKKYILTSCLFFTSILIAQPFEPNVIVQPTNITSDTNIEVGINLVNYPCLIPVLTEPNHGVFRNGNQLELVVVAYGAIFCNPLPIDNPPYQFYSIGQLEPGTYNIDVRIVSLSSLILPFANDGFIYGTISDMGVVAPIVIPSLNIIGVSLLFFLIMFLGLKKINIKRKKYILFSILIISSSNSFAEKVFHILLSPDGNAPTPEEVVAESFTSPPPPNSVLESFDTYRPNRVKYAITERPVGDLLSFVESHPQLNLSRLYRYLVLIYDDSINETLVKDTLFSDQYITSAVYISENLTFSTSTKPSLLDKNNLGTKGIIPPNSYLQDLGIPSAWQLSEGSGYVGVIDSGVELEHSAFKAFDSNGNYLGGNLLEGFYTIDFGQEDLNVDERQPVPIVNGQEACEDTDNNPGYALPTFVGHGTHVNGIVAANNSVSPTNGICKNCGLSVMKYIRHTVCGSVGGQPAFLSPFPDTETNDNVADGIYTSAALGIGVVNLSGGIPYQVADLCDSIDQTDDRYLICDAITELEHRNSLLVASAGNNRGDLQFPASDKRVVAAGGIDKNGLFWNESPGPSSPEDPDGVTNNTDNTTCPYSPSNLECGSAHSFPIDGRRTDVVTQSKLTHSTFYTGAEWNSYLECADDYNDTPNDGLGYCTGTSMSAPQVAAIMQLIRSTIPLLPNGNHDPLQNIGVINVLNSTATSDVRNSFYGYGMPDARKSLEKVLGKSNNVQLKNRLTPMFDVVSTASNNNIYSSFPQVVMSFLLQNGSFYIPNTSVPFVNEFTDFWYDHNPDGNPVQFPPPRAEFYVFTTNNNPFTGVKDMIPLRRMEKSITGNRNDTYAVSNSEIKSFHDNGYNYAGIEGYILPTCTPTPSCIPSGSRPLYRDESDSMNHKLIPSVSPLPNSTLLGYVYLNEDTDADGLIDGQERILGTNINIQDTDGDGMTDVEEYPPAGVPFSDPLISDIIFENGFEV